MITSSFAEAFSCACQNFQKNIETGFSMLVKCFNSYQSKCNFKAVVNFINERGKKAFESGNLLLANKIYTLGYDFIIKNDEFSLPDLKVMTINNLSSVLICMNQGHQAISFLNYAMIIINKNNLPGMRDITTRNLSAAYLTIKSPTKSVIYDQKSMKKLKRIIGYQKFMSAEYISKQELKKNNFSTNNDVVESLTKSTIQNTSKPKQSLGKSRSMAESELKINIPSSEKFFFFPTNHINLSSASTKTTFKNNYPGKHHSTRSAIPEKFEKKSFYSPTQNCIKSPNSFDIMSNTYLSINNYMLNGNICLEKSPVKLSIVQNNANFGKILQNYSLKSPVLKKTPKKHIRLSKTKSAVEIACFVEEDSSNKKKKFILSQEKDYQNSNSNVILHSEVKIKKKFSENTSNLLPKIIKIQAHIRKHFTRNKFLVRKNILLYKYKCKIQKILFSFFYDCNTNQIHIVALKIIEFKMSLYKSELDLQKGMNPKKEIDNLINKLYLEDDGKIHILPMCFTKRNIFNKYALISNAKGLQLLNSQNKELITIPYDNCTEEMIHEPKFGYCSSTQQFLLVTSTFQNNFDTCLLDTKIQACISEESFIINVKIMMNKKMKNILSIIQLDEGNVEYLLIKIPPTVKKKDVNASWVQKEIAPFIEFDNDLEIFMYRKIESFDNIPHIPYSFTPMSFDFPPSPKTAIKDSTTTGFTQSNNTSKLELAMTIIIKDEYLKNLYTSVISTLQPIISQFLIRLNLYS